ncbi:MAG: diaminopimelate decarboxylase, partial [Cutibacterium granulosum]|nr:diaminopimelate decarboxylase [Cutibacterium granulosum]
MTHMHVAGSVHADVASPSPTWLTVPADVNSLDRELWSTTVTRNEQGALEVGGVSVVELAQQQGTALYVLDEEDFRARATSFRQAFDGWDVYYAGKAFLTRSIAGWVHDLGLCMDVCTSGELVTALEGGMDPERIGMHGNNKSVDELRLALNSGV